MKPRINPLRAKQVECGDPRLIKRPRDLLLIPLYGVMAIVLAIGLVAAKFQPPFDPEDRG